MSKKVITLVLIFLFNFILDSAVDFIISTEIIALSVNFLDYLFDIFQRVSHQFVSLTSLLTE